MKFGWALTAHKAMSYKWNSVLINTDLGDNRGRTNESYFRWLYSALTRAKESATFINYTPINSFSKIEIKFSLNKKHKEFYFVGDENYQITNQDYQIKNSFNFPDNKDFLLDFYHLLLAKFTTCNIQISLINHYNYQEQYELIKESQKLTLSIYYNAKAQFKKPTIIASSSDKFNDEISLCLSESTNLNNFNFITDTWRQEAYKKLQKYLDNEDSNISYIIQKPYKDMLLIQTNHNSFNVDINYNGDGFFTKVDILYDENNEQNANNFKKILEKLKV